jgi:light-regulated signal transduction histidine kinase (bacteriophytochrome)
VELQRMPVNLSLLVREVILTRAQSGTPRTVETVVAPDLEVIGDERLLRIALENLLENAWKFTSLKESARIEFGSFARDGRPVYFVRDNGAGFESDKANTLFIPFHRLHAESEFEGTGIGLATVKRIIERHDGKVWAEGRPGEGATFYFTLG